MAGRRKLIVVSNRGPITYGRGTDGERLARRGGGGLVTALRSLVSHHDVTWIASAMSDEDRAVAVEAGGARDRRAARATARRSGCGSSPTTRRPTTGSTTSSRTRCSGSCSTTSGSSPTSRRSTSPCSTRGTAATRRQRDLRGGGARGARGRARGGGLLPRLPPLPRAAARPRARSGRAARALRPHPVAADRLLARAPRPDPAGDSRGRARQRPDRVPHAAVGAELHARRRATSPAPRRTSATASSTSTSGARS